MTLKLVENFDHDVTLEASAKAALFDLLKHPTFLQQIAQNIDCERVEFTEHLFQPVAYSPATPKGMPAEFESFYASSNYVIVNVPPSFMFKAKIFKPSRLCAVYEKLS